MKSQQAINELTVETDKVVIKDVIVADPSISLVITSDILVKDFEACILLDKIDGDPELFEQVAKVSITQLTAGEHYISVPFGDSRYEPGIHFNLAVELHGRDPRSGEPVNFPSNPRKMKVISAGIIS